MSNESLVNFIREHKDNVYRLAFSYVKNKEDALDITQDSIQKALINIHTLKTINALKSWFYRIVINTSLDFLRKQQRVQVMDDQLLEFHSPQTEDQYTNLDLERALDDLPHAYRTIIILRYFEDLKIDEIAETLDENINTIKTRLYRGLQELRVTMSDEDLMEVE
ncbi:RNA polymerase sigma factor [Ammoniphilus oxalaticus]|uniref:RNA polymerase sigma factor n=1 Tax=Ammoniphilus oxalaticus TaxID=66863 RepID=UPI003CCC605F